MLGAGLVPCRASGWVSTLSSVHVLGAAGHGRGANAGRGAGMGGCQGPSGPRIALQTLAHFEPACDPPVAHQSSSQTYSFGEPVLHRRAERCPGPSKSVSPPRCPFWAHPSFRNPSCHMHVCHAFTHPSQFSLNLPAPLATCSSALRLLSHAKPYQPASYSPSQILPPHP